MGRGRGVDPDPSRQPEVTAPAGREGEGVSPPAATEPAPRFFGIEITRRCNLTCPHCFTSSTGRAEPGPKEPAVHRLLDQLVDLGVRQVAFSGGEPLLRDDLESIMRYGRRRGIEGFGLVTNGYFADARRVKSLVDAGLQIAQVSIDGVDAHDHCDVRACQPGAYYRSVRAVRLFRDARIRVDVATLLTRINAERAGEMALLCEAIGAYGLRYCSFVPTGRARSEAVQRRLVPDASQIDGFVERMRRMNAHRRSPLRVFIDHGIGPWVESGCFACEAGRGVAYVTAAGDLYPCPGLIFPPFRVGNAYETPLAELFASPEMHRVRTLTKSSLRGPCRTCANDDCSGGCRGGAFAETGDVNGPVGYCYVARHAKD